MGRSRKGRAISGFLIVDKPAGITSTAVVNKVRWTMQAQKAGHAGTLDPAATGLLAVALGEATKVLPFVTDALKAYEFTTRWGQETTTDDAEGEVTRQSDLRPTDAQIEAALPTYRGDIMQVPPAFSAVKVDGERAYDLARDLGRDLGCFGHVTALRRIWSGPFTLRGSVTWEEIEAAGQGDALDDRLLPLESALVGLPECPCPEASVGLLRNGGSALVFAPDGLQWGEEAWASRDGRAIAVGHYEGGSLRPTRVFAA